MSVIKVNTEKQVKKMKPMHGGGQPPITGTGSFAYFHYLKEAGIPYSRLHDVGGVFGGGKYVDIPNVFRNFDADADDPANYDFTFTDHLLKGLFEYGIEPYFRLGVTIENAAWIKPYYACPPKDYNQWAKICEHIIAHYTEGWADGFHYNIKYWEIWNEPEVQDKMMWNGTDEEFYELYHVAATHLKARFPHLSIGGYASCGFYAVTCPEGVQPNDHEKHLMTFFEGFFAYIKERNTPIDFFSWHSYTNTRRMAAMDKWLHNRLNELGYGHIETHLNEWNNFAWEHGTGHHGTETAATMIAMQHGYADVLCIYDMRNNTSPYCPMFDIVTKKPVHGYYAMVAFNTLYKLGMQVETECDTDGLYVLCASNGKKNAMMIANLSGKQQQLEFEGVNLEDAHISIIDNERLLSWAPDAEKIPNNATLLIEW